MSSTTAAAGNQAEAAATVTASAWTTAAPIAAESTTSSLLTSTLDSMAESIKAVISSTAAAPTTTSTTTLTSTLIGTEPSSTAAAMLSVSDLSSSLQHFGIVDYLVFVLMLIVCAVIGFYFGFVEKKKKKRNIDQRRGSEALDYLVGGRKMKVFPVSLSLVASFVSGISLLGTSTEIYVYGTQYAFILVTLAISGVISWYVFLPVFCNLQLTSTYEYLEMRFDKGIRLFGSVLFTIGTIFWLPIVIFVPALAFNQVTGVNIHIVTPVVCIVCIFYTCVGAKGEEENTAKNKGGLKAVVWTDVIQTVIMLGAIVVVIIKGTLDVGGLGVVIQRNYDSGRIEAPVFSWDITERTSMLAIFVGSTFFFVQTTAGNQVIVQRYLSLPSLKEAKKALIGFTLGVILLTGACFYNGLLIFATYHDCDPLSTKLAKAKDQLVPLLVMDILGVFPGMAGVFVAGVFSAALSSLSTGLNSLSAVFLEDYIKPLRKTPLSEFQTAVIMRASVVIIGIICVGLVFVVERLGTVLQLSMTLNSIASGPLLGLFLMGLLLPWINAKSALFGSLTAFGIMTWICIMGQLAIASHELVHAQKPVTTEGCTYSFEALITPANSTVIVENSSKTFMQYIYHMSFLFYVFCGCLLTIFWSSLASFIFGINEPSEMNLDLFSPFIRRFIKPSKYMSVQPDEKTVIMEFESKEPLKS